MNPECPYCQNPARYDLLPAEELDTVTTTYERAEGDIAAKGHAPQSCQDGSPIPAPDRRPAAFSCGVPELVFHAEQKPN